MTEGRRIMTRIVALALAVTGFAVSGRGEVRQVFREERFSRGDENVQIVQSIDRAAWI